MKIIKQVSVKGNNKRIVISLGYNEKDNTHYFVQETKTLVDRKKRQFVETNNIYSVETFSILKEVFNKFLDNGEIKNKILNLELSKISEFKGSSNF